MPQTEIKANNHGINVYNSRVNASVAVASELSKSTAAADAIKDVATTAKALTAGANSLEEILKKIQADLATLNSKLETAHRELGAATSRQASNLRALASANSAPVEDSMDRDQVKTHNAAVDKADSKVDREQRNINSLNTNINTWNSQKWGLTVLAQRIFTSLVKVNASHEELVGVRDKLVVYRDNSFLHYLKFSVLAKESSVALTQLWNNLKTKDEEQRFEIYNKSIMNLLNDHTHDGQTMGQVGDKILSAEKAQKTMDEQKKILDELSLAGHGGQRWYGTGVPEEYMDEHPELKNGDIDGDGISNWDERQWSYSTDDIDGDGKDNGHDDNPFVNDNKYPNIEKSLKDAQGKYDAAAAKYNDAVGATQSTSPQAVTNSKALTKDEYSFGDYTSSQGSHAINDLGKTLDGLDQLTNGTLQSSNPVVGVGTLLKGAGNTGWHLGGAALHTVATVPALAGDLIHGINDVGEWILSD